MHQAGGTDRSMSGDTRIFRWSGPKNCLAQGVNLASGSWVPVHILGVNLAASDDVFDPTKGLRDETNLGIAQVYCRDYGTVSHYHDPIRSL